MTELPQPDYARGTYATDYNAGFFILVYAG
jgi:hypothetical protein